MSQVQLLHPTKTAPKIDIEKYEAFREALLAVIPADADGVPFGDLTTLVEAHNPTLNQHGSVGWYTTTVKLDLEARGEIERVPGAKPQRVRRPA